MSGDMGSSEGSRVNSILIGLRFLKEEAIDNVLFGLRWSETGLWIKNQFPNSGMFSSMARGHVDNILSALLLKSGLFGVFTTFTLLGRTFSKNNVNLRLIFTFLIFSFFSGMLMYQFFWFLIIIFSPASLHLHKKEGV